MKFNLDIKGTISPFSAIGKAFEHPKTICYPSQKKEMVDGYRGFHTNLLETCIGCANCQDVCMNDAIDMITIEEEKNPKNGSACIPRIDYGRCCWCSLCTDVCPPSSLKLESESIWASEDSNNFLYMPKDK
jgi:formate hydrogenlyase subunit 6/NADH:ubiquinone oxidoreductase subunit I